LANWGYMNSVQLRLARARLDEAEGLLRELDAPALQLDHQLALFQLLLFSAELEPALAVTHQIKQLSDTLGYGWGLSQYYSFRGALHLEQGDIGASLPDLEEAIRLGRQFSVGQSELIICAFQSRALAAVGQTQLALAGVQRAYERVVEHMPFLLTWPL